eukprot:5923787-Amphidinium_carterae.1
MFEFWFISTRFSQLLRPRKSDSNSLAFMMGIMGCIFASCVSRLGGSSRELLLCLCSHCAMAAPELPLDNVESNEDVDRVEVCSTKTCTTVTQEVCSQKSDDGFSLGASAAGTHQAFLSSTAAFQSWSPAPQAAARGSSPQQPFSSDHNETAASALVDGCGQGQQAFLLSTAAPPFQFGSPAPQPAAPGSSPQQPFSSDHNETAASALVDGWGQGQPSESATRKRGHRRRKGRKERRKQKQQMRAAHSAAGSHSDGAAPQQTSDDGSFIKVA